MLNIIEGFLEKHNTKSHACDFRPRNSVMNIPNFMNIMTWWTFWTHEHSDECSD